MGEGQETLQSLKNLSILVVDDEKGFLNTMEHYLRNRGGFEVATAASSKEAFAHFLTRPPDLVLLDIHLGKEDDGIQCLENLRKNEYKGPVFMMTGDTNVETLIRAQSAGANDFLVKPFADPVEEVNRLLSLAIRRALTGKKRNNIFDSGYLRSRGLTNKQITLLSAYTDLGYPPEKRFAQEIGIPGEAIQKRLSRIREKLDVETMVQLARLLTILEMFSQN